MIYFKSLIFIHFLLDIIFIVDDFYFLFFNYFIVYYYYFLRSHMLDEQPDLDFKPLEESDEDVALEDSKLTKSYSWCCIFFLQVLPFMDE